MATSNLDRTDHPDDEDVVIELNDISVRFEMARGSARVLDGIDLDVYRNETIGIVGESGSGKSMCVFSIIDGVEEPGITTGEVTFYRDEGDPVSMLSLDTEELRNIRWEEIAIVSQAAQSAFNPTMTIRAHFQETLTRHRDDIGPGMEHARELLSELYLPVDQVMDSYPHNLSGGMQQRALIALALVLDPNVLILDEPTASLDLLMQRSIVSLLDNLQDEYNLTMLFVTHDLPLVTKLADRIAVMYAFEIVELGPTNQIVNNAFHPYTRALINAVPNISSDLSAMQPIEGSSPDPVNVPAGCSFHPRCPLADETCEADDPDLYPVENDGLAACHYTDQVDDAIELTGREIDTVRYFDDLLEDDNYE